MFFQSNDTINDMFLCGNNSLTHPTVSEDLDANSILRNTNSMRSIERSFTFDEDDITMLCEQRQMTMMPNSNHHRREEETSSSECLRTPPPFNNRHWDESDSRYRSSRMVPPPPPYASNKKCILYMEEPCLQDALFVPSLEMMVEEDEYEPTFHEISSFFVTLLPRNANSIFKMNEAAIDWDGRHIIDEHEEERISNEEYQYRTPTAPSSRKSYGHMVEPSPKTVVVPNMSVVSTSPDHQYHEQQHSFRW